MKRRDSRKYALELVFEGSFFDFEKPVEIYKNAVAVRGFEDDAYIRTLFSAFVRSGGK